LVAGELLAELRQAVSAVESVEHMASGPLEGDIDDLNQVPDYQSCGVLL
jgi:hypothetical protein